MKIFCDLVPLYTPKPCGQSGSLNISVSGIEGPGGVSAQGVSASNEVSGTAR